MHTILTRLRGKGLVLRDAGALQHFVTGLGAEEARLLRELLGETRDDGEAGR